MSKTDLLESLGFSKEFLKELEDFEKKDTIHRKDTEAIAKETKEIVDATEAFLLPDSKSSVNLSILS